MISKKKSHTLKSSGANDNSFADTKLYFDEIISHPLTIHSPPTYWMKKTNPNQPRFQGRLAYWILMVYQVLVSEKRQIHCPGIGVVNLSYLSELIGEMLLGDVETRDVIRANAAVGFNPLNTGDNFFYAQIDPLSLKEVVDAMNYDVTLPPVLQAAEFPGGLVVGFTSNKKGQCQ